MINQTQSHRPQCGQDSKGMTMLEKSPVSDVCTIITRGISPAYDDTGIPVLSQKCVRENQVILEAARFTNPEMKKIPADKLLRLHDVLVNSTGVGTLGRVAQVNRLDGDTTVDSHVTIVRPDPKKIDPRFFGYSMVLNQPKIESMGEGATGQTELSRARLGQEILIPRPPLLIQRQIADILSAYDDLIENNLKCIKILEEMARSLYREWFVYFRFPGYEKVKFVDSALGKIPEGWEVKAVEEVVERIPAGKKYDQKTVSQIGAVPVFDQGKSGVIGYHDDEPGVKASEDAPVVVFANHTCYQRIVHFPFSAIQNVLPFTSSSALPRNIYWLYWATNGLVVFNDYKGHWPEFSGKTLAVPSVDICQRFGDFTAPLSRQILKLERAIENLRETRDLLLPDLLSGKLELRNS